MSELETAMGRRAKRDPFSHFVVGIGASAGGLEALQRFFEAVEPGQPLAYVIVQHLSPDYKSLMVELLAKHTQLTVMQAQDGMICEPNKVYQIPPRKNMTIEHGRLRLTESDHQRQGLNLPIDVFFRSLAEDAGERSIAVVLSGTGSDGTRGIRAIKEAGGLILVQDEGSSRFFGMPSSAINTGLVDLVSEPERMPRQISDYIHHPFVTRARQAAEQEDTGGTAIERILRLLKQQVGVDFAQYKRNTILRRVERRMGILQIEAIEDYLLYLRESPEEIDALFRNLLIGVTKFFRDTEAWDELANHALPELLRGMEEGATVRAWVVGCSTGEEAYSTAMLLKETIDSLDLRLDYKVFATDIDKAAIETASTGTYPESVVADIPPDMLNTYFMQKDATFIAKRALRDRIIFATQNAAKDPPFTRIDLITCRNFLIYLMPEVQAKLLSLFHFALREKGMLMLGSSETIGEMQDAFEPVDSKWRVYRKREAFNPGLSEAFSLSRSAKSPGEARPATPRQRPEEAEPTHEEPYSRLRDMLLEKHVPISLFVDREFNLLHSFGPRPPYLSLPGGRASLNVLRLLPKTLSLAVASGLKRAVEGSEAVEFEKVRFEHNGTHYTVSVKIVKAEAGLATPALLLQFGTGSTETRAERDNFDPGESTRERIEDLEQDLQFTRENLQATIEELETSNEELQATNQELLAANEELQSTNEELESVNEELYTVNSEYQGKITELSELNNDMDNMLRSSDTGILFLGEDLTVRKFTASISREIPLRKPDAGRRLSDISHPLIAIILELAESVLAHGQVRHYNGSVGESRYLLTVMPYRTAANQVGGVVVNVMNLSVLEDTDRGLELASSQPDRVLGPISAGLCILDEAGRFLQVNQEFCRLYGYKEDELLGNSFTQLVPREQRKEAQAIFDASMKDGAGPPLAQMCLRRNGSEFLPEGLSEAIAAAGGTRFRLFLLSEAHPPGLGQELEMAVERYRAILAEGKQG